MFREQRRFCSHLTRERIMELSEIVTSQIYEWIKGHVERKPRQKKKLALCVVERAVQVIMRYPHWGGKKGAAFMLYHGMAVIGEKLYQWVKVAVVWAIQREIRSRRLLPAPSPYSHQAPASVGEIWSGDFTHVHLEGVTVFLSVVRDNLACFSSARRPLSMQGSSS